MDLERRWGMAENGSVAEIALAPSLIAELESRWPPLGLEHLTEPREPVEGRFGLSNEWMIVPDLQESGDSPSMAAWDLLESALTLFAVTRLTRLVAVHSAAIAHHGQVLVVPANSEAGKSTLSIAAADVGATVLSDEYTLIDPGTGLVTGWQRPLRRRRRDGGVDRLNLAVASEPMPVGLIAAVAYDPRSDGIWRPISPAEATAQVLSYTICAGTRPDASLNAVLSITRTAPAIAGHRPEATSAIPSLLTMLSKGPQR